MADSTGMIHGVTLRSGQAVSDFPLNAGAPLSVPPVAGDVDGDGDIELLAITAENTLYAWDLPYALDATKSWQYWLQAGGGMENGNHFPLSGNFVKSTEVPVSGDLLPETQVYCWPNPVKSGTVQIRYWLRENATVRITIYDLSGQVLDSFEGPGVGSTANETGWAVDDVPSGVYVARVEATGNQSGETAVRLVKIAVVK